jgi:serine/threonine-protein kinase
VAFDLWSLNVLLLEAITGHHPFRGGTVEDTLDRIRKGPVAATFAQLRHSSSALASYFERALAKDAASRPSNAAEVADALRRVARSS